MAYARFLKAYANNRLIVFGPFAGHEHIRPLEILPWAFEPIELNHYQRFKKTTRYELLHVHTKLLPRVSRRHSAVNFEISNIKQDVQIIYKLKLKFSNIYTIQQTTISEVAWTVSRCSRQVI